MLSAALLSVLFWVGNTYQPFGTPLPAMGPLLSPFEGFWQNAESVQVPEGTVLSIPSDAPYTGEVLIDERGVPHIFAPSMTDAAFLQGYVEARDRLWQMDISIRAVGGRLAELFGPSLIERDRDQRKKGFRVAARRALEIWQRDQESYAFIEAYSAGANAYITNLEPADYPLEFKLLGYAPEPWTPFKTALYFKNMAQILCMRADDIAASQMRARFGSDWFERYYPERNPRQSPVISADQEWAFEPVRQLDSLPELSQQIPNVHFPPAAPDGLGSNNWALSGSRTASGNPLLANDMHLNLTLPAIWYEVQIHTPEVNSYGVTLPGVPGIIVGFNEDIAWGITNVSHDVLDWYRIEWADPAQRTYLLDGAPTAVEPVIDTIQVKGAAADTLRTPWTIWGPVVYDSTDVPNTALAMRWMAHEGAELDSFNVIRTFIGLMKARNYADYRAALRNFTTPSSNFVFAARDGDIGLTVTGAFPLRRPAQGRFVQDGSRSDHQWAGIIPPEQVPAEHNPTRGFVGSANQRSADPSYPYYYLGRFDDYRGRYIHQRLAEMTGVTYRDMQQLQLDNYSLFPADALPVLLPLVDSMEMNDAERRCYELLKAWSYRFEPEEKAPVLFEQWWDTLYDATVDEIRNAEGEVIYPEDWRLIELLEEHPNDPLFDDLNTSDRESAQELARRAFRRVVGELPAAFFHSDYTYAGQRPKVVRHLGNIPAFSSDTLYLGGYADAPNAIRGNLSGPSWRMIVHLDEQVRAWGVYPGGQSGNPGSRNYTTGVGPWAEGRYFDLFFMRDRSDRSQSIVETLQLQ